MTPLGLPSPSPGGQAWAHERRGDIRGSVGTVPQATTASGEGSSAAPASNEFVIFSKPELGRLGDDDTDKVWDLFSAALGAYGVTVHRTRDPHRSGAGEHRGDGRALRRHQQDLPAGPFGPHRGRRAGPRRAVRRRARGARWCWVDTSSWQRYPDFSPYSLGVLFANLSVGRLGPGTYAGVVRWTADPVVILNGFHPRQLSFFTADDTVCAFLHCSSDTAWDSLRNDLIGTTDPAKADAARSGARCSRTRRVRPGDGVARTSTACTCRPVRWRVWWSSPGSSAARSS